MVLQAAHDPFARVVGVELSEQLKEAAERNIARTSDRPRRPDVELVTTDVLEYEIPDDQTVAFFANPFQGAIFATVIERLVASVDRRPRRLRIIYRNPVERDILMSTGRVRPGATPARPAPPRASGRGRTRRGCTRCCPPTSRDGPEGRFFQFDGIELVFADESLTSVANKALERETGARGARTSCSTCSSSCPRGAT